MIFESIGRYRLIMSDIGFITESCMDLSFFEFNKKTTELFWNPKGIHRTERQRARILWDALQYKWALQIGLIAIRFLHEEWVEELLYKALDSMRLVKSIPKFVFTCENISLMTRECINFWKNFLLWRHKQNLDSSSLNSKRICRHGFKTLPRDDLSRRGFLRREAYTRIANMKTKFSYVEEILKESWTKSLCLLFADGLSASQASRTKASGVSQWYHGRKTLEIERS